MHRADQTAAHQTVTKSRRGFASMNPARLREVSAMGGRASPANKRTFALDSDLARRAGQKGGRARSAIVVAATVAGEGLAVVLFLAALWCAMFLIPWDEAMASATHSNEPGGVMARLAFAGGLLSVAITACACLWLLETRVRAALARRAIRRAAEQADRDQAGAELDALGDASLYGRQP